MTSATTPRLDPVATAGRPGPTRPARAPHHRRRASRVLDVVAAGTLLVLTAPLMGVTAVLIRCTSPGPALFRQTRLGQDRRPFTMLKFRSMYAESDDELHRAYVSRLLSGTVAPTGSREGLYKLSADPRITPVGRWMRTWSIDELPQLINVLRGEMAIVGPRPVLPWEAALFGDRYARRFDVPPGITGRWQTSGRNRLTMTDALELDVRYAECASLRQDLAILLRTVPVVLRREGVR